MWNYDIIVVGKLHAEFSGFSLYLSNKSGSMDFLIYTLNESDYIYVPVNNVISRYIVISKMGVLIVCEIAVMEGGL